jgi:lipopolysaccharide export system permease protein
MVLAPIASKGYNEFNYNYLSNKKKVLQSQDIYRQINANDYIYVSNFNIKTKKGNNFVLEHFEGNRLAYKIRANSIRFVESDSSYRLNTYQKTIYSDTHDQLITSRVKDTVFDFEIDDLTPLVYVAETLDYKSLTAFIEKEEARGSSNINRYKVVKYKKWSIPVSVFILTIIAVAVSSIKRRGGMGVNLAFGIVIAMIYVFFDKVFGVMAAQSNFSPLLAVWFPNIVFGILAIYLLKNAKR